jgi:hypothetical protein
MSFMDENSVHVLETFFYLLLDTPVATEKKTEKTYGVF